MITLQIVTSWQSYLHLGNNELDIETTDSLYAPPIDSGALSYLIHDVLYLYVNSHVSEYIEKLLRINSSNRLNRADVQRLLNWCEELQQELDYAPIMANNFNEGVNRKTILYLKRNLKQFNDEDYDGQHHYYKIVKTK